MKGIIEIIKDVIMKKLIENGYDGLMCEIKRDNYKKWVSCFCVINKDFFHCQGKGIVGSEIDSTRLHKSHLGVQDCIPIYKVICDKSLNDECDNYEFCVNTDKHTCPYKEGK